MTRGGAGRREQGFTMIEMMIVLVLVSPLLYAALSSHSSVNSSLAANEARADLMARSSTAIGRITPILRGAVQSTLQAKQTLASAWLDPVDGQPAVGIRFRSADGMLTFDSGALTPVQTLEFELEDGETANASDDDGDGLVDEGRLVLRIGTSSTSLLREVVGCQFVLNDGVMVLTLDAARPMREGRTVSWRSSRSFVLRNK